MQLEEDTSLPATVGLGLLSGVVRFTDLLLPLTHGWLAPPANQFSLPQVSNAPAGPRLQAPGPGGKGE